MRLRFLHIITLKINLIFSSFLCSYSFDSLTLEQREITYGIVFKLKDNNYHSTISLNFPDGTNCKANAKEILNTMPNHLNNVLKKNEELDNFFNLNNSKLAYKILKEAKITIFSPSSGLRLITLKCSSMKFGKMRIGFIEIPSNKILIENPAITYY